jgi:hypothetical protein
MGRATYARILMKLHLALLFCACLALSSCAAPPRVSDSWRDPAVHEFNPAKTLVVVMSKEDNFRRVVEDEFVRHLAPGTSGPSYEFISKDDLTDTKKGAEAARAHGFDSVLVLRVLDVDEIQQRVPGAYSPVFVTYGGGAYGSVYLWPTAYDQGYTYMEKTYRLETNLYGLSDDKLVWSGVVVVRDPDSVRELATLNANAVLEELHAQKLVR